MYVFGCFIDLHYYTLLIVSILGVVCTSISRMNHVSMFYAKLSAVVSLSNLQAIFITNSRYVH